MRRADREIKDFNEIVDVIARCDTLRLGLHGETYPYVVPLSFGYECVDNTLNIYVHGAKLGKKQECIEQNKRVCVEMDIFHGYQANGPKVTTLYESVIGYGEIKLVEQEEAMKGLQLLMQHCGYEEVALDERVLPVLHVYKIVLQEIQGKRNLG